MTRRIMRPTCSVVLGAAALAVSGAAIADDHDDDEIPFDVATIFFELNNTDGDLGIHALIDGEPWKRVEIEDPDERKLLKIRVKSRLRRQGLTELFFESAEPTFDELDPEDFFARFPEGEYEVSGVSLEGDEMESESELSHILAAPPGNMRISGVPASEDCDESVPAVSGPVVISWDPVTTSHPDLGKSGPVTVEKYQVVVEREEPTSLVMSIDLPPDVTEIEIPEEFIDLGDEFKFEILVRAGNGNQTAEESCFEVE